MSFVSLFVVTLLLAFGAIVADIFAGTEVVLDAYGLVLLDFEGQPTVISKGEGFVKAQELLNIIIPVETLLLGGMIGYYFRAGEPAVGAVSGGPGPVIDDLEHRGSVSGRQPLTPSDSSQEEAVSASLRA